MKWLDDESTLTFTDNVEGSASQPVVYVDDLLGFCGSGQDIPPLGCDLRHHQYIADERKVVLTRSMQSLKIGNRALVSAIPKAGWTTFLWRM